MQRPDVIEEPILSVLIVTYRSVHEIGECLESIPRQLLGKPVEIIVADNHSDDGTADFVGKHFPDVRLLPLGENSGFSKANNRALKIAAGSAILYLNPDTVVNREALEACLLRLRADPKIGIISPRLAMADGAIDPACRRSIPSIWDGFTRASGLASLFPTVRIFAGYNLSYLPENGTYDVGAVNGAFMMLTRQAVEAIGPLDERFFMYAEDLDLCLRCSQQGYRVVYDGAHTITHYKGRSSSQDYKALSRQIFEATDEFYQKHFNPRNSLLVRWRYHILFGAWYTFSRLVAAFQRNKTARPV